MPGRQLRKFASRVLRKRHDRLLNRAADPAALEVFEKSVRPVLVEKSPNNLLMGRFLQSLYPGARLIVVMRHPVVVALAMAKWDPLVVTRRGRRRVGFEGYIRHWIRAHEILASDAPHLDHLLVLRYEHLVADPVTELERVRAFLDLDGPIPAGRISGGRSGGYEAQWQQMRTGHALARRRRRRVEERYGDAIRSFGYDLDTLGVIPAREGSGPGVFHEARGLS